MAWYLDGERAVRWWHRLVARQDYCIQGWQRHRVYPDFLACVEEASRGRCRLTILETKGIHLSGNPDTEYKRRLFDLLTRVAGAGRIEAGNLELFQPTGETMVFRLLLADTWRTEFPTILRLAAEG